MRKDIIIGLSNWINILDEEIGDTEAVIQERRKRKATSVELREDLKILVKYIEENDLPIEVYRALKNCLSWNPYYGKGAA